MARMFPANVKIYEGVDLSDNNHVAVLLDDTYAVHWAASTTTRVSGRWPGRQRSRASSLDTCFFFECMPTSMQITRRSLPVSLVSSTLSSTPLRFSEPDESLLLVRGYHDVSSSPLPRPLCCDLHPCSVHSTLVLFVDEDCVSQPWLRCLVIRVHFVLLLHHHRYPQRRCQRQGPGRLSFHLRLRHSSHRLRLLQPCLPLYLHSAQRAHIQ